MTYRTHKVYAVSGALIAAMYIYMHGLSTIDYYLALPILLMTGKYGGLFPDVDHEWVNVKDKTVPNWFINKLIHLTGGNHRSWQTHSIDIYLAFTIASFKVPSMLLERRDLTLVNYEIMSLMLLGFISGWGSHLLSDMMTGAGVRLVCWSKFKVAFVPRKFLWMRFNTGNEWEDFNYFVIKLLNIGIGTVALVFPALHSGRLDPILEAIKNMI